MFFVGDFCTASHAHTTRHRLRFGADICSNPTRAAAVLSVVATSSASLSDFINVSYDIANGTPVQSLGAALVRTALCQL